MEPLKKFSFSNVNKNQSNISKSPSTKKKNLPGPINPLNFIVMAMFKFARKPLLIDINYRIGIYLCVVSVGSVYFDIFRMPPSYFSNKYNVFNQLFVKWAWGWTLSILFCFIVTTSYIYTGGNTSKMRRQVLRLFFGTIWWYLCTGIFQTIENETGACHIKINNNKYISEQSIPNKRICKEKNGIWLGFDISGHVFLLVLCNMWIFEEAKILNFWYRLDRFVLSNSDNVRSNNVTTNEIINIRKSYRKLNVNVKIMSAFLSLLSILWDVMLLATIIYFHNMPSKLTAVLVAVGCWFLSYRFLFKSEISFMPNLPETAIHQILA